MRTTSPSLASMARPCMPSQGRTTRPASRRSRSTPRAALMGIAKPIDWASSEISVLMPITRPQRSTSGPPEFPGLIGASVWIIGSSETPGSVRLSPLTMPRVIVWSRPSGVPMATTPSPTFTVAEAPNWATGGADHRSPRRRGSASTARTIAPKRIRRMISRGSTKCGHHPLGQQVDLRGVVGHRAQHEVLEAGVHQVLDARVDAIDRADHVALLQVLPGAVRAHGAQERRLRPGHRLVVALVLHQVDEVAVAEREGPRVAAEPPSVILQLAPVALDPLLLARAAREPVAGLHDAIHDGLGDDRHVVLAGVGDA